MQAQVRRIIDEAPDDVVQNDLEEYRKLALNLGATDARIITAAQVIVDERVILKCSNPRCPSYGTNANCPPYAPAPDLVRKAVDKYHHAIFIYMKVPSVSFAGPEVLKFNKGKEYHLKVNKIVSTIEAKAFYDGYYLAMGYGTGPCLSYFCGNGKCAALEPGGICRFPLKSRPSMEASGMDVFKMSARMGWEVYPCGAGIEPNQVPHGSDHGLVLID